LRRSRTSASPLLLAGTSSAARRRAAFGLCDDRHPVRWIVTLSGSRRDVERLAAELPDLSPVPDAPRELLLELVDPEADATGDEAPHAAKAVIDSSVRHINGFGRLRWGRNFERVEVSRILTINAEGRTGQRVFAGTAYEHMLPEDFADMVEQLGRPRPDMPAGLDVINALEGEAVTTLAATKPDVARMLHLLDLMLEGDEEIDWGAAYSALEVIEHDLHDRGLKGQDLGWWTAKEKEDFRATATSVEVLGEHARHGKPFGLTEARMTREAANWFVRRVAALWVTWLLEQSEKASE
jgi:hypothetical protein